MLAKVSFKKQLCHICLQSFSPVQLVRVNKHPICHNCLKLVELSESNPPPPEAIPMAELDTTKQANIAGIIAKEGAAFLDKVKQLNAITPGLIGTMIGRITVYLPGIMCLKTSSELYPVLNGMMTADFVTWFIFNAIQLPFISRGAVMEFLVYGGMTGFLFSQNRLYNIPADGAAAGMAALAFFFIAFIKTTWWGLKIFMLNEELGEEDGR